MTITIFLGISRIFGFFRDVGVATLMGPTYAADMAVLILTTQDLLLNFFIGNAFPLALMSTFMGQESSLKQLVYKMHGKVTVGLIIVLCVLCYNMNVLVDWLSPGLPSPYNTEVIDYLMISMMSVPFTIYASIVSSALNFSEKFISPALSNAVFNIIICAALLISSTYVWINPFYALATSVVVGAIVRWAMQLLDLSRLPQMTQKEKIYIDGKKFFAVYGKSLLSTSVIFIVPILARILASGQGEGQISIFNLISKLIDMPIMLISGAVVTVLTPKLLKTDQKEKTILWTSGLLFCVFSLIFCVFYMCSDLIIHTLLYFGKFPKDSLASVVHQFKTATWIFPFYSAAFFMSTAFATTTFSKIYPVLCAISISILYIVGKKYIITPTHIYIYMLANYFVFSVLGVCLVCLRKATYFFREEYSKC